MGFTIFRAFPSRPWPGVASLEVSIVWFAAMEWRGARILNDQTVNGITSLLTSVQNVSGNPFKLSANAKKSYQGSIIHGQGFVLTKEEALALLEKEPASKIVVKPYLAGEDLNTNPDQSHSRYVIAFLDWPLNRETAPPSYEGPVAADFPEALAIIEERVKPDRATRSAEVAAAPWWQFWRIRSELYSSIQDMRRVLVTARVSPTNAITFSSTDIVFHEKVVVFPLEGSCEFLCLQSSMHWEWARLYTATLGATTLNYSPTDCFETFPFPTGLAGLESIGETYHDLRRQIMLSRQEGLTKTYNRFHSSAEQSADILQLRALQVEMDRAVALAYGWPLLVDGQVVQPPATGNYSPPTSSFVPFDLGHGFHETKQGLRFTLSEPARREVLDRLLALNHQRHAEEVAASFNEKKSRRAPAVAKATTKRGRKAKLSATGSGVAVMPGDFRFPAPSPHLYAVNLVTALLSARPGGLAWRVLRDSFAAATTPALMRRLSFPQDRIEVAAWEGRWNEQATPDLLIPTLREMTGANIAVTGRGTDAVFALQDGPQEPATEDVAYDAWLALRVVEPLTSPALPEDVASVLDAEIVNLLASV